MRELSDYEVNMVNGAGAGEVASCVAGGSLGARVGLAFGPWAGLAGAVVGCGIGLALYSYDS